MHASTERKTKLLTVAVLHKTTVTTARKENKSWFLLTLTQNFVQYSPNSIVPLYSFALHLLVL